MRIGVVIGASGGIGEACTRSLAYSVDRLLVTGRDSVRLQALGETLSTPASVVVLDLREDATPQQLSSEIRQIGGEIAWVVVASGAPLREALPLASLDRIRETFLVDLVGPALLIRKLLDLRWVPKASIVVIGSISASRALPNRSVYAASKAGLEHLARSLAAEVAERGIRVNVVSAGVIDTPFLGAGRAALDEWVDQRVPARRMGMAKEVAEVVRYLAVDAPLFLTGARIVVDGGAEVVG